MCILCDLELQFKCVLFFKSNVCASVRACVSVCESSCACAVVRVGGGGGRHRHRHRHFEYGACACACTCAYT